LKKTDKNINRNIMTYLYWFTKYAWSDKIWKVPWKLKAWNLFLFWEEYYLSLWDEISFFEQYIYEIHEPEEKFKLIEKNLISKETIKFINYMVYERYCPYYNVMKYFLPQEIDKLIERKVWKKNLSSHTFLEKERECCIKSSSFSMMDLWNFPKEWETLIVFPDLWTLINMTDDDFRKEKWVDTLLSTNTQNQKDKSRRNIKLWNTKVIFATHSEIFQNYYDLKKIIIVYPHKRYYTNQQDPRYKTLSIVQKMSEIYDCELEILEN